MAPEPFEINISQEKIESLKAKLSAAEFPEELEKSGWDLGVPLSDVKRLTKAWEKWDWRKAEEKLNRLPQFHTGIEIDGFGELDIHFVWQISSVKNAIPLLFSHGCRCSPGAQDRKTLTKHKKQGLALSSKFSTSFRYCLNQMDPPSIS